MSINKQNFRLTHLNVLQRLVQSKLASPIELFHASFFLSYAHTGHLLIEL